MNAPHKVTIGDCTLYLGDCRDIMPALGKYDAVVTDPPYGMGFQSGHRKEKYKTIANDNSTTILNFACSIPVRHSLYVWMRWDNLREVPKPNSLITWVKNNHSMGDLRHEHGRKTEVCAFYAGPNHYFRSRPTDVVFGDRTGNTYHPTQKPISIMTQNVGWTCGTILDPFMGSGTTGVACVRLGRKFTGIELDPDYFEISCERIRKAYEQPDMFVAPPENNPLEQLDLEKIEVKK